VGEAFIAKTAPFSSPALLPAIAVAAAGRAVRVVPATILSFQVMESRSAVPLLAAMAARAAAAAAFTALVSFSRSLARSPVMPPVKEATAAKVVEAE